MAVQLQERDKKILSHIGRYRMTTNEALDRLFFEGKVEARKSWLKRMKSYITSENLFAQRKYYRLLPAGAQFLGLHKEAGAPLGAQAKPTQYGIYSFCCLRTDTSGKPLPEWPRYTRRELAEDFPEHGEQWIPRNDFYLDYYIDYDGKQARLGQIHVDLGGDYQRLISTCRGMIKTGLERPGLRDIIADGLFAIALVTSDRAKETKVLEHLSKSPLQAPIRVHVIEDLMDIIKSGSSGGDE